jgi:hypothetical protein
VSDALRSYLAQRLTERLGDPDHTGSGQTVWVCRYGDEPALVTIAAHGDRLSLHVLQAPDRASIEVCATRELEVIDPAAADRVVALLSRELPP